MFSRESKLKALVDFWHFIDVINFHGGVVNFDPVHKELADFLARPQAKPSKVDFDPKQYRYRFITMHRSGFKSTLTVAYCMWRIYRNPNIRILLNSAETDLSKAFIREIMQYFVDDELQDNLWNDRPHIEGPLVPVLSSNKRQLNKSDRDLFSEVISQKTIWNADGLQVIRSKNYKEITIASTSARRTDTGMHYDIIVNDDLVTFDNSNKPEKARKIYLQASDLESVLDPPYLDEIATINGRRFTELLGGEVIITGTPYYHFDYNCHIREHCEELGFVKFERNIYVNGVDSSDGYTCPSRFNDEYVEKLRARLIRSRGVKAWSAQYLLKVVVSEHQPFVHDNIQKIFVGNVEPMGNGIVKLNVGNDLRFVHCIATLDPAVTTKATSDSSGFVIGGVDELNNLYLVGGFKKKLPPTKLAQQIDKMMNAYKVNKLVVESGVSLSESIIDIFHLVSTGSYSVATYTPRGDKAERINVQLEPYFGTGAVNTVFCVETIYNTLVEEIQMFDPESENNTDDFMDAVQMLLATKRPRLKKSTRQREIAMSFNRKYGGFL